MVPPHVRGSVLAWVLGCGLVLAIAAVPSFRSPWSKKIAVQQIRPGVLASDWMNPVTTPYISFATVRYSVPLAGSSPALSLRSDGEILLTARLVATGQEHRVSLVRPIQFHATEMLRVEVSGDARTADVTLGYDGRDPAVRAIRYWWPWLGGTLICGTLLLVAPITWPIQVRLISTIASMIREHRALAGLLGMAMAIRAILVWRGGQYFDFDEWRYGEGAAHLFELLSTGNVTAAIDALVQSADHPGFRIAGLIPAFFHVVSAWFEGRPISEMRYPSGEWLPAMVLSSASVCSIGLTYALAHRLGASRRECVLAATLMLASSSMLMYSRHFVPYDVALALLLLALWIALGTNADVWRSYAAGLIGGFAFLTYAGYWLMAAAVGGVLIFTTRRSAVRVVSRTVLFGVGLVSPLALLVAAGEMRSVHVIENMRAFSESAKNGDFSEGWSLPWVALWHAEGWMLAIYIVGVLLAFHYRRRGLTWLLICSVIYAGLVIGSNAMHRFVVYDRISRQMFPLVCLATAYGFARLGNGRWLEGSRALILYASVVALGLINAAPHVAQRFPREIVGEVLRDYDASALTVGSSFDANMVTASLFLPISAHAKYDPLRPSRYVLLNATDIWSSAGLPRLIPEPAGRVLLRELHPRQRPSMQYHGYTPAQRAYFRSADLSIRLIDTSR